MFPENDYNDERDPTMDLAQYLAARLQEMKERVAHAEKVLENLVVNDMVEILVDPDGIFTYRMTAKGRATYTQNTGMPAPINDISFHDMY
jgi:CII-binding regulator of phage lambda lysogenization HflD